MKNWPWLETIVIGIFACILIAGGYFASQRSAAKVERDSTENVVLVELPQKFPGVRCFALRQKNGPVYYDSGMSCIYGEHSEFQR